MRVCKVNFSTTYSGYIFARAESFDDAERLVKTHSEEILEEIAVVTDTVAFAVDLLDTKVDGVVVSETPTGRLVFESGDEVERRLNTPGTDEYQRIQEEHGQMRINFDD